ncbi:hypothetical protein KY346_04830 [Candidatus Woesearchaeota archaeon]|nr:hypothetical protein [Candidatus Woesearchaeota archaeon]
MDLNEKISDGIIEKERPPGQTSTIVFNLGDRIIQYSSTETREERIIKQEETKYASDYFG